MEDINKSFGVSDLSKEDQKEMDKAWKEIAEAEKEQQEKEILVLEEVKAVVTPEMFEEIESCLVDSDNTYGYKITDKPQGEFQQEDEYPALGGIWVDQTTNGGMAGDDFAGTISIKLGENKYFEFGYWM